MKNLTTTVAALVAALSLCGCGQRATAPDPAAAALEARVAALEKQVQANQEWAEGLATRQGEYGKAQDSLQHTTGKWLGTINDHIADQDKLIESLGKWVKTISDVQDKQSDILRNHIQPAGRRP